LCDKCVKYDMELNRWYRGNTHLPPKEPDYTFDFEWLMDWYDVKWQMVANWHDVTVVPQVYSTTW